MQRWHRGYGSIHGEEPPVSPKVEVWLDWTMPSITELMAVAKRLMGVVFLGPESTQATADQLGVATLHARERPADHPWSDPAIGEQFTAAFHSFTVLANDCAAAGNSAVLDSHALDDRAGRTVADLSIALCAKRAGRA